MIIVSRTRRDGEILAMVAMSVDFPSKLIARLTFWTVIMVRSLELTAKLMGLLRHEVPFERLLVAVSSHVGCAVIRLMGEDRVAIVGVF